MPTSGPPEDADIGVSSFVAPAKLLGRPWRVVLDWAMRGGGRARQGWFLGAATTVVVLTRALMSSLDSSLHLLHGRNIAGHGVADLAHGQKAARNAIEVWEQAAADFPNSIHLSWGAVATAHLIADLVFVAAFIVALGVILGALIRDVNDAGVGDGSPFQPAHKVLVQYAAVGLPYLALISVAADLAEIIVLNSHASGGAAFVLWVVHIPRLILTVLVLLPVVIVGATASRRLWHRSKAVFHAASLLQAQVFLVAVLSLLLLVSTPGEQVSDAVRLWPSHWRYAALAIGALTLCCLAVATMSAQLIKFHLHRDQRDSSGGVATGLGVVVLAVGWWLQHSRHWGVGIEVLGGIVFVIGALSLVAGSAGARGSGAAAARRGQGRSQGHSTEEESDSPSPRRALLEILPAILAAVPFVALGIVVIRAAVPELVATTERPWLLLVLAVVLPAAGVGLGCVVRVGIRAHAVRKRTGPLFWGFVALTVVLSTAVFIAVVADPWSAGSALGVLCFVGVAFAVASLTFGLLGLLTEWFCAPMAFRVIGFKRTPGVVLLVLWALLGVALDNHNQAHAIRILPTAAGTASPVTVQDRWAAWLDATFPPPQPPPLGQPTPAGGAKRAVPLVLMSAAGGGIRAATWTALVGTCLFETSTIASPGCGGAGSGSQWGRLFAASGASGGSVGIASLVAQHDAVANSATSALNPSAARRIPPDLLSAEVAWQLFVEAPGIPLRAWPSMDRAQVMERAWERGWADEHRQCPGAETGTSSATDVGFLSLMQPKTCPASPLMFLSGTSMTDGCRFNVSAINGVVSNPPNMPDGSCKALDARGGAGPDMLMTRDLVDFLCSDEDVRLATAGFLSARFPFVSPIGRVIAGSKRRPNDPACKSATGSGGNIAFVGDGGYRDNTGASALDELWTTLEPLILEHDRTSDTCVVPIWVHIDNGYSEHLVPQPKGRIVESAGPLTGALSVFTARDSAAIQQAAVRFDRPLAPDIHISNSAGTMNPSRFVAFGLDAHPGVQAPLGWSLSPSAEHDLEAQLSGTDNKAAFVAMRDWLSGGATCTVG